MTDREHPLILVTGGTGQIGFELVRELAPLGDVVAPSHVELDLAQPAAIRAYVRRHHPDLIVNAAAYTAVDRAESERELCYAINAEAPSVLADEAKRVGAPLIHYSTDYVFDGKKQSPYVETDTPAPLNIYGASKLAGERAIEAVGGAWVVLRTSWVFGTRGKNFLTTILRLAREPRPIRVVDDQRGTPTWARAVAVATRQILEGVSIGLAFEAFRDRTGIYHVTGSSSATWFAFARAILTSSHARQTRCYTELTRIGSHELSVGAVRPMYSVLSSAKLRETFGLSLSSWDKQLESAIADFPSDVWPEFPAIERQSN